MPERDAEPIRHLAPPPVAKKKHYYGRGNPGQFYRWLTKGTKALDRPPPVDPAVVPRVGDVYVHIIKSDSNRIQVWVRSVGDEWEPAEIGVVHPATHDRELNISEKTFEPSWILSSSRMTMQSRKEKQQQEETLIS